MAFNQLTKGRSTSTLSSQILEHDIVRKQKSTTWNYRSILGTLNYLKKSTRPDLAYEVHQCTCFDVNTKECHVQAMVFIGRYLHATKNKGIVYRPKP